MFQTPILYIVFNRLDTVVRTFERIRSIQPENLYIAADGPRNEDETKICQQVRTWCLNHIDWQCNVHTLFRESNLGCGKSVSHAITWFFNNVDKGIILEDDCLPDMSFFPYCSELLEKYENNSKVMHIAGYNPLVVTECKNGESYYFEMIQRCWGWASWARAWKQYKFDIDENYKEVLRRSKYFSNKLTKLRWEDILEKMQRHEIDTWDYQWAYKILEMGGFCINPCVSLIQNIGMNSGVHYAGVNSFSDGTPAFRMDFPLVHPVRVDFNRTIIRTLQRMDRIGIKELFFKKIKIVTKKIGIYDSLKKVQS